MVLKTKYVGKADFLDIPWRCLQAVGRCLSLQIQTQAKFVATSINVLSIYQCR